MRVTLDRLRSGRVPEEFRLLEAAAANAAAAADLLDELIHHHPERADLSLKLAELSGEGERLGDELARRLNATFVTPIEREDLLAVAIPLQEIVAACEDVAGRFEAFEIDRPRPEARRLATVLLGAARSLEAAAPAVRSRSEVEAHTRSVREAQRMSHQLVREGLAALFREHPDAPQLIGWKDLLERLGAAVDAAGRAASGLETIATKHAHGG